MFTAALFKAAQIRKQLNCPPTDEWIKKCGVCVCVVCCVCVCVCVLCVCVCVCTTQPKKEWNFAIYNNMDEHLGYYF